MKCVRALLNAKAGHSGRNCGPTFQWRARPSRRINNLTGSERPEGRQQKFIRMNLQKNERLPPGLNNLAEQQDLKSEIENANWVPGYQVWVLVHSRTENYSFIMASINA